MDQNKSMEINSRDRFGDEFEIDFLELFSFYLSKLVWIIIAFLIGAIIAGSFTHYYITPKYTATAKMYMVSSGSRSVVDLTDLNLGQSISSDYAELIKTRPIIESVIKEQDLNYTYHQLVSMLNISIINDTRILAISATGPDPKESMVIANALSEKCVSELPKLMEIPSPHIAEYATVPVNRSSPSLTKNTLIGALIGLLIVLAILTLQFMMDDTFKTADDIEKEFGIMPMTVIPEGKIEGLSDSGRSRSKQGRRKHRHSNSSKSESSKSITNNAKDSHETEEQNEQENEN